jgi:hypothetical protein
MSHENPLAAIANHLTPAELRRVQQEILGIHMGSKPERPHPVTLEAANRSEGLSLEEIVKANPELVRQHGFVRAASILLTETNIATVAKQFPKPRHRAFTRIMQVPDFRSFSVATGADGFDLEEVLESGEGDYVAGPMIGFDSGVETGLIKSFHRRVAISRRLSREKAAQGWLQTVPAALTAAAYRLEAKTVYSAMESNPNMSDGNAWFIDGQNQDTGVSLSIKALINLFKKQTLSNGDPLELEPAVFVLPTSYTLTDVEFQAYLNNSATIITTPSVTHGYAIADPNFSPSIGLLAMNTEGLPLIETKEQDRNDRRDLSAIIGVTHDFGVLPISRYGIVRIPM